MKTRKFFGMAILLLSLAWTSMAGEYTVIANSASPVDAISKAELRRIYSGRMKELGGEKVIPINIALDSPTGTAFLSEIMDMSPQEYKEYWVEQQVKGVGSAPMVQKTAEAVVAIVSQIPGAIGYIPADKAAATVKTLTVK